MPGGTVYCYLFNQPERYSLFGMDVRSTPREDLLPEWSPHIPEDRLLVGDMSDFDSVARAVEGVDLVIHFAAVIDPYAPWESVLKSNVVGTHNLFEANRQAHVERVIFGSLVDGYVDLVFAQRLLPVSAPFDRCTDGG